MNRCRETNTQGYKKNRIIFFEHHCIEEARNSTGVEKEINKEYLSTKTTETEAVHDIGSKIEIFLQCRNMIKICEPRWILRVNDGLRYNPSYSQMRFLSFRGPEHVLSDNRCT